MGFGLSNSRHARFKVVALHAAWLFVGYVTNDKQQKQFRLVKKRAFFCDPSPDQTVFALVIAVLELRPSNYRKMPLAHKMMGAHGYVLPVNAFFPFMFRLAYICYVAHGECQFDLPLQHEVVDLCDEGSCKGMMGDERLS